MDVHRSKNGAAGLNGLRIARVCMRETCDNRRRRRRRRSVGISLFRSVEKRRCRARARGSRSLPRVEEERRGEDTYGKRSRCRKKPRDDGTGWAVLNDSPPGLPRLSLTRREILDRDPRSKTHSTSSPPLLLLRYSFFQISTRETRKNFIFHRVQVLKISLYRYVLIII